MQNICEWENCEESGEFKAPIERDNIRNFQPPVSGEIIMNHYKIKPCKEIGLIKEKIKNAILDGEINNDYDQAFKLMLRIGDEMGLKDD